MKIACISDLHGDYTVKPSIDVDLILIAGDSTNYAGETERFQDYLDLMSTYAPIVGIAGNHDEFNGYELRNWHYLENSSVQINGIKIYGSPYSYCNYRGKQFPLSDNSFQVQNDQELDKVLNHEELATADIFLSHMPAFGLLDQTNRGELTGSYCLRDCIAKYSPKLFVCGHIHESYGAIKYQNSLVVNAAQHCIMVDLESL